MMTADFLGVGGVVGLGSEELGMGRIPDVLGFAPAELPSEHEAMEERIALRCFASSEGSSLVSAAGHVVLEVG